MADRSLRRTSCSMVLLVQPPCSTNAKSSNGEPRKLDQGVDGRRCDPGEAAERGHRHQTIAHVLVHVAMIERGGRLDGLVRLALLARARNVAAVARRLGGEPR